MNSIPDKPIRRNSLISPWGIGSIIPFANDESLMIAGLDAWNYPKDIDPFLINDDRFKKRLGVSQLREPPDFKSKYSIPAVRFPSWYYCPYCGEMEQVGLYDRTPVCNQRNWSTGRVCNNKKKARTMIPERFIVICPEGHIDDFPIAEWVHSRSEKQYNPQKCVLRRSTGGSSASLTGVRYECTCGASRSLAGAMNRGALANVGYYCRGAKPWLGVKNSICERKEDIKITQRGASNVWFPDIRTSIFIPHDTNEDEYNKAVDAFIAFCSHDQDGEEIDKDLLELVAKKMKVDATKLFEKIKEKLNMDSSGIDYQKMSEEDYRFEEYKNLTRDFGSDSLDFYSINKKISCYDSRLHKYFSSISLIKKLRETRALVGFSRLEPINESNLEKERKMLSIKKINWLPAIQVFGEGVFIEFNNSFMSEWASREDVQKRICKLDNAFNRSFFRKGKKEPLQPEFVAIHTFAHLLINQLSFDCGYGSSSLRERIYYGKTSNGQQMCGVLIYTASGDSEGSLGGLVRQGNPGRIEDTIIAALKNAEWCSYDPVCIQSEGQGPDSLNLAACYNCALLPETSCENGNRLLDRGVVVGTLDNKEIGYFADLIKEIDSI